jgi:hypothetical protein
MWYSIAKSSSLLPIEKIKKIKLIAHKLEDKALKMEELSKVQRNPNINRIVSNDDEYIWVNDDMKVNDLLVDAIKAKLQVLDNL